MGIVHNGKDVKLVFNGKAVKAAYYNGKKVYGGTALPTGIPSTAKQAFAQLYSFTRSGTVIQMAPTQPIAAAETTYEYRAGAQKFVMNMAIKIDNPSLNNYELDFGSLSGNLPAVGSTITRVNTIFAWYKIHDIYVVIDDQLWCAFNMNGQTKMETFDSKVPASPQFTDTELYQKADEYYNKMIMYSTATVSTSVPLFKPLYDALVAKIASGATKDFKIKVYWA